MNTVKKQREFDGLEERICPTQIFAIKEALDSLDQYDVRYEFVIGSYGTKLIIENFIDVLQSPNMEDTVSFVFKPRLNPNPENSLLLAEDYLLIVTIGGEFEISAKLIDVLGNVKVILK